MILMRLPFPGIAHGGLEMNDVYPIIDCLPDNVKVWRL
jgi:hypothetical protein